MVVDGVGDVNSSEMDEFVIENEINKKIGKVYLSLLSN